MFSEQIIEEKKVGIKMVRMKKAWKSLELNSHKKIID